MFAADVKVPFENWICAAAVWRAIQNKSSQRRIASGSPGGIAFMAKGLSHIALKSRDLKKTEEFYIGTLGMKIAFRHPPKMLFVTTPGSGDLLNFVKSAARTSGAQALEHIGFKVSPSALKKIEQRLNQRGVKIDSRRGKDAIYFSDPNGYQIEYYCD
jgi:catechol 2,3-dioxygenase-like lactoylglutathione lyase family enzyme